MRGLDPAPSSVRATDGALSRHASAAAKIAAFRSLFRGRELDTVLDAILRALNAGEPDWRRVPLSTGQDRLSCRVHGAAIHIWCNVVQGATALPASTASMALWNL
jgi:hypothetical protein